MKLPQTMVHVLFHFHHLLLSQVVELDRYEVIFEVIVWQHNQNDEENRFFRKEFFDRQEIDHYYKMVDILKNKLFQCEL